ncbi:unnamed protein product [Polarella glacialis]|uniref:Protein-UDP acetylgalactosaminyltransferase 7 n=1 Tax=Polarella glacialis TaxID=89957 RepID=A0A813KSJ0_POLGL|nr:unnamed protein product [Polarella glacialis]
MEQKQGQNGSCFQKIVVAWILSLLGMLMYAHHLMVQPSSSELEAHQEGILNRAATSNSLLELAAAAPPVPVASVQNATLPVLPASKPHARSVEEPLRGFDNNAPRPPPREGDYEEYTEAPDILPGADNDHMHGLLGRRPDGSERIAPIPLPPGGLTPEDRKDAHRGFCFNSRVSDSLPLDRLQRDMRSAACIRKHAGYPTDLPSCSVVIVFHDESLSALLRSIHSVLNNSPPQYLKEIILIDDASQPDSLRFYKKHWQRLQDELSNHVKVLPKVRLARLKERRGLMVARMEGVWRSSAAVTVFLDSHIEATKGWLEPILSRIKEDKRHVVVPSIDSIGAEDFVYRPGGGLGVLGFSWSLGQDPYGANTGPDGTVPAKSPVMAGGLLASDTKEFLRLGGYDPEMRLYSGEEMEIGFRTWMCGGDIEYIPCSHVGHIFRTPLYWQGQVYKVPGEEISRNKLRTAEVWMDEYKSLVKFALAPLTPEVPIGDMTARRELRRKLNCKDFSWYLETVIPNLFVPRISPTTKGGALRNQALDGCFDTLGSQSQGAEIGLYPCHGQHGTQAYVQDGKGLLRVPQLGYRMCVSDEAPAIGIRACLDSDLRQKWTLDPSTMQLRSGKGNCAEASSEATNDKSPYTLKVAACRVDKMQGVDKMQEWRWS